MSDVSTAKLEVFNSLLSGDLDAIEDLPDYVNPATGTYLLLSTKAEIADREFTDKATGVKYVDGVVKVQFQITGVLEATPTEEQLSHVGNLTSVQYSGEYGIKQIKKLYGPTLAALNISGEGALQRFVDALNNGIEFAGTFQRRYGEEKIINGEAQPRPVYSDIKAILLSTELGGGEPAAQ